MTTTTKPLSTRFVASMAGLCCQECGTDRSIFLSRLNNDNNNNNDDDDDGNNNNNNAAYNDDQSSEWYNLKALQNQRSYVSPLVSAPMLYNPNSHNTYMAEQLIGEYIAACKLYGCETIGNAGILTTLRFALPALRVSGGFHDADMLALTEILLKYSNTALKFIHRLDFTVASKYGKIHKRFCGFTSHGAFALSKVLQQSKYIRHVQLPGHRVGPYGASAIFLACRHNNSIRKLQMRRCKIGEKGGLAFAEVLSMSTTTGLIDVDLSSNGIGHYGTKSIERFLDKRFEKVPFATRPFSVNLEGNLVFPEIMNGVTHGLGVLLCLLGGVLLTRKSHGQDLHIVLSCYVYTTSLLVLYTSSTLYHSFFSLQNTKYIFEIFDKCAIYFLIAGSYTPFLQITLCHEPIWSIYLLSFIWFCAFFGICVEACFPTWRYRSIFSLSMYLGLGWAALVCLPQIGQHLNPSGMRLIVLGGVAYTAGVPFFVRDNNLDHSIWHLFVLAGSIIHWISVYCYVVPSSSSSLLHKTQQ